MFRDRAIKVGLAVALVAAAAPVRAADQPQSQSAGQATTATTPERSPSDAWTVPDVGSLPPGRWADTVRLGRDLTTETYAHIGPEVADPAKRFAGSNMACQSCHLEAGTKKFGLPFVGVFADFPQYRAREGEVGTLEDRINGCMTRSLNGKALPIDSPEMKAFVAYIKFLSDGRPIGGKTPGRGSGKMDELVRAADLVVGRQVYEQNCSSCHGADGQGQRAGAVGDAKGYLFPPLWGTDSFNDGAGMGRLISAANFIRSNMPNGTTHDRPVLSPEEAWDVAAYLQSRERPKKPALDKDYPVRSEKAVDAGYGPFEDGFDTAQHKYGPFQPIRAKANAMKSAQDPAKPSQTDQ